MGLVAPLDGQDCILKFRPDVNGNRITAPVIVCVDGLERGNGQFLVDIVQLQMQGIQQKPVAVQRAVDQINIFHEDMVSCHGIHVGSPFLDGRHDAASPFFIF